MTPTCHPERAYMARGMCNICYQSWYTQNKRNNGGRLDSSGHHESYRKPPHKPKRNAECHPDRPHVARGLCGSCYQKGRPNLPRAMCHPDKPHAANGLCAGCYSRNRYKLDPEQGRKLARESGARVRKRLRDELVEAYGGKCACANCPETNPAFLTLEHTERDGQEHRAKVGSHSYADLRRRGWPKEGFTLLCWNCNAMTRFGRRCPHEGDD